MTRDDIIRMARKARLSNEIGAFGYPYLPELERFAALIAAAEREAVAKMFDGEVWAYDYREIAAAIRARGEA